VQVTTQHVAGVEPAEFQKAFGQAHGQADRPADPVAGSQADQDASTTIFCGRLLHGPCFQPARLGARGRNQPIRTMTAVSPPRGAAPMTLPYRLISELEKEVQLPDKGILSRTLFNDDRLKVVLFGFAQGEELSEHTASMPAVLHFVRGEATVTFGDDRHEAKPGTWVHMPAGLRLEGGKLGIAVRAEDGKGHGRSFAGRGFWGDWMTSESRRQGRQSSTPPRRTTSWRRPATR
jgi:hypothetical protein